MVAGNIHGSEKLHTVTHRDLILELLVVRTYIEPILRDGFGQQRESEGDKRGDDRAAVRGQRSHGSDSRYPDFSRTNKCTDAHPV